jgi:hypothetical protein
LAPFSAIAHQADELGDAGAGRIEDFRQRFGAGPACLAILGQALALVERRRIQAGAPRQAGGCQAMHGRKVIDGPPDLFMLQHGTYVFSSVFS